LPSPLAEIATGVARDRGVHAGRGFAGWDPYDALKSPLFRIPGCRRSSTARFAVQQVVRRLRVNVRPLLGSGRVSTRSRSASCSRRTRPSARSGCVRTPLRSSAGCGPLVTPGFSGACWGYDFPWQSRSTLIPAYSPTVVATAFVTNGLFALTSGSGSTRRSSLRERDRVRAPRSQPHRRPGGDVLLVVLAARYPGCPERDGEGLATVRAGLVRERRRAARRRRASIGPICRGAPARGRGLPYAVADPRTWWTTSTPAMCSTRSTMAETNG